MRHEWVFDVLTDLLSYSQRHGLPGLAQQVEGALKVARAEIDADDVLGGPDRGKALGVRRPQ